VRAGTRYGMAQGMVKARYADLSAQSADTTAKLDKNRLRQAVNDVTGGILDHNGGPMSFLDLNQGDQAAVGLRARVFATNQSLPNGARVVYGPSSRAQPFPSTPEWPALGYLVAEFVVRAIDQETAHASGTHSTVCYVGRALGRY
jgi:hypothetical protein